MPAIAALSLNDGQTTPVSHTFSPVTTNGSKASWADRTATIPSGYLTISEEILPPSGARTTWKATFGFYMPVVATVNGSDVVVRYSSASLVLNLHPDSTMQERKDLRAYINSMLTNTNVKLSVENLENFY